jgi:hypothetical protein
VDSVSRRWLGCDEFGVKVSIATTNAVAPGGQFVLSARALPGNLYNGPLGRNFLLGTEGDATNLIPTAAATRSSATGRILSGRTELVPCRLAVPMSGV